MCKRLYSPDMAAGRLAINWLAATCLVVSVTLADAASREDPLRPPGYKVTESAKAVDNKAKTWSVNEILHSEGRRIAIVNNETVKKGDVINGARVLDITAEQVTLQYQDRLIHARLNLIPVKKLITNSTGR